MCDDFQNHGLRLHLRTVPENRPAMMAALMVNATTEVMMSRFLSIKLVQSSSKVHETLL